MTRLFFFDFFFICFFHCQVDAAVTVATRLPTPHLAWHPPPTDDNIERFHALQLEVSLALLHCFLLLGCFFM